MSYKRISPLPINEGGTNTQTLSTTDGTIYFDGTKWVTTAVGTSGQVLKSNGAGMAPTFQNSGSSVGNSFFFNICGNSPLWTSSVAPMYLTPNSNGIIPSPLSPNCIVPISGTISSMYVIVTSNSDAVTHSITLQVNNVSTSLGVTITGGSTGTFTDLVHSASVSAGDQIRWIITSIGSGSGLGVISCKFTT